MKIEVFAKQSRLKQCLLNLLPDRSIEQPSGTHRYGKFWRGTLYEKGGNFDWRD